MNTQSAFGVKLGANGRNNSQHCWPNNVSATTPNNTQQTDATCNIQRCWELVANDVASLWPGYAIIANYLNTLKPLLSGHSPNSLLSVHGHFVVPVVILRCHGADGNGNKNAIKAVGCKQQNKNCAREAHFLVHFFSVTARLRRENAQFHHSYLSGMVRKPVRLLCYTFLVTLLELTVHNLQQRSCHFELTDQQKHCIDLLSQFVNKKQRIVRGQGASNINHSTIVFNIDVCRLP